MKAIEEIKKILNWYHVNGSSANITELLDNQDKLTIWAANLGEFVGELSKTFNQNYFIRKLSVSKRKIDLIKNGSKIGQAEDQSLIDNEEIYQKEIQSQGEANQADILLRQTNRVIDAMRTRVSYLKTEKENA